MLDGLRCCWCYSLGFRFAVLFCITMLGGLQFCVSPAVLIAFVDDPNPSYCSEGSLTFVTTWNMQHGQQCHADVAYCNKESGASVLGWMYLTPCCCTQSSSGRLAHVATLCCKVAELSI